MKVIVIGAGTGGLALAQSLNQSDIEVAVYERDRTRRDGLFGFRVGISPDGSRALAEVLPTELFNIFKATTAVPPRYFTMLTEQRKELLSIGGFDESQPGDPGAERSVSRMTLRQVLLTGLEKVVHFDKKFTHYQVNNDQSVTAHFDDGSTATGDLLVGADGSNSAVRKQYLPEAKLKETGLFGVTAKLPLTEESRKLLTPKVLRGVTMVQAPGGDSSIIHVMEFPWDADGAPKSGAGSNDAELLKSWPGMTFDNTRDYIMLGFSSHRKNLPENFMDLDSQALHTLLQERTAAWHPDLHELFRRSDPSSCFPLNIRTTERLEPWPSSQVTLIGDAIHTMTPGLGVGANTALQDAQILASNLRSGMSAIDSVSNYETQLHGYAWTQVEESLKRFNANDAIYNTGFRGRFASFAMRTGMRLVNAVPPLKKRMAATMNKERDRSASSNAVG
ncbi:FAD-dependent oxidoreductase [Psychromicrobium lacuslunae]|uniref:FAD-binding monooxygenase n=1 Tax=Psychromicrobium lacuslunae TaxID=1618207 RepID=A0A0D4C1N3_9MICC|nr:NAD(P)/FAD-dependent oxidoreductase [Psychromicrobium lacuslunae]AJT42572.1 FAD-binding monooxygenase [Psychromicrobium lacuslunae]